VKAVVVYESLWGNTAAIARAIAEGIGDGAQVLSTAEATPDALADTDLIVAGAPVLAFHMSSDRIRATIAAQPEPGAPMPDLSHPSLQSWLETLAPGTAPCAAFDTEVRGPFGKAAPTIAKALQTKGYHLLEPGQGFVVSGKYGPLRAGELQRANHWGERLRGQVEHPG
jgi:flavodoxin